MAKGHIDDRAFKKKPNYVYNGELVDSFRKEEAILKKRGQVYARENTASDNPRVREIAERRAWEIRNGRA